LGFLWNESLTPIATKVKSAHANELHTNIDTDLGLVGLGGYAWTRSPVIPVTHKMLSKDVVEMMDALDDAYDANKCTAHNSSHFDIDNAGDNTSHQAVHDVTVLAGHDITALSSHFATDKSSNDSGVLAGHDSGYNAGHNDAYQATHYVTHQGSNQSSNNGSYNGAHEDSFNSPDRSSYYSGWNDINNYPD
jgi:hypothetical protein